MAVFSRPLNRYTVWLFLVAFVLVCVILFVGTSEGNGGGGGGAAMQQQFFTGSPGAGGGGADFASLSSGRVVTLDDVLNGRFYSRSANCSWSRFGSNGNEDVLSWMSGNSGDLVVFNPETNEKRIVIAAKQFVSRPWKFSFSGDAKFVLVRFEPRRLFRSTILARYAVHDAKTGKRILELRTSVGPPSTVPPTSEPEEPEAFQLATWSKDNKTILVVSKNDLFAIKIDTDSESMVTKRVTTDGSDTVFNGIADWVYEEEVFTSSSTSVWTSPSGVNMAYVKFNDSTVEPVNYNLYGDYSSDPYFDPYFQYAKFGTVRYPKSGTSNPTVSIHVVKLGEEACWIGTGGSAETSDCNWGFLLDDLMSSLVRTDNRQSSPPMFIIGSLHWITEHVFAMNVLNRVQNSTWVVECSVLTRSCAVIRGTNKSKGWVDVSPLIRYGNEYVTLVSSAETGGVEYIHAAGLSTDTVRMLTKGEFSVDEVVGIYPDWGGNKGTDVMIFKSPLISTSDTSPSLVDSTQTHFYALPITNATSFPSCLTCYSTCTHNTAKFSPSGTSFVNTCERTGGVSRVHVLKISPKDLTSSISHTFEENERLDRVLQTINLPEVDYFMVPYTVRDGSGQPRFYNLSCKVMGPKGWKVGEARQFPVVMDTYSGPNSQKVTKRFSPNDWSVALASNKNTPVVYFVVDGIGSGRQSSSMSFEVYRDLGNKEVLDKIFALKYLLTMYKSLDPNRTLIWGWSYGGYVSSMAMGKDTEDVLKCGISVAPVVNWHYYDTIYTERYMSTPSDNPAGYNHSNVLLYADNFRKKDFLLVHGNADDNVHYQQSMVLARALEQKGILFRMQSYPDENHSLGGVRPHLFRTLEDFVFNQCFAKRASPK